MASSSLEMSTESIVQKNCTDSLPSTAEIMISFLLQSKSDDVLWLRILGKCCRVFNSISLNRE